MITPDLVLKVVLIALAVWLVYAAAGRWSKSR